MNIKNQLRYTLVITLIVVCVVMMSLLAYLYLSYFYYQHIQPYKPVINTLLTNATSEHKNLPSHIRQMMMADLSCSKVKRDFCNTDDNLNHRVTRLVSAKQDAMPPLDRHIFAVMMDKMLVSTLDDSQKYTLIAELTPFTIEQTGYNNFSQYYFNKPLSELSLAEGAELVAITHSPSRYLRDKTQMASRIDYLMQAGF